MAPKKLKIGGVLVAERLGMVSVLGAPQHPGIAGAILSEIGTTGISAEFISCCPDLGGGASITICVDMDRFDEALECVTRASEAVQAQKVVTRGDLCSVAVFGPHFRELPNIASRVFEALAEAGINIHAISTSVSSVTCVLDQARLKDAIDSLEKSFEFP